MSAFRIRGRRWWQVTVAAALVAGLAALLLKPALEQGVRARIEAVAIRHGTVARIGALHIGIWPLLRLERVDLDLGHGARLQVDRIAVTWPGRLRLALGSAVLTGPAGITVSAPATAWNVTDFVGKDLQLALVEPRTGLSLGRRVVPAGSQWLVEARALQMGNWVEVRRGTHLLLDPGIADGRVDLMAGRDELRFRVDMGLRGARLGGLTDDASDETQMGSQSDVTLRFDGDWQRGRGTFEIPEIHAAVAGAALSGSLAVRELDSDPVLDLDLGAQRLDFAQLLAASGLAVPDTLGMAPGRSHDLGSATINLQVRGRVADPASLSVSQKIDFKPPREMPPAIARLRGDFIFRSEGNRGPRRPINVSPASADFISLKDVPPLFVRTLLMAEDVDFYGHRGIDLRELPGALLTNWSRGAAARGASTITQQLAKNLFLSSEKRLGRKLQELAITFLLESALGKERILEIYLNIIEWGPGLRGLRPAALDYFGREPGALTPAQMAFLVSIIPGPIKYQSSFAHGSPGPGLRSLMDDLLAKLHSVDAIGAEEYQRALREPVVVANRNSKTGAE